jgi:hypothetical protein
MFDQYVKLFDLSWLESWLVEALVVICKAVDCLNGENYDTRKNMDTLLQMAYTKMAQSY